MGRFSFRRVSRTALVLSGFANMVLFQNCDGGLAAQEETAKQFLASRRVLAAATSAPGSGQCADYEFEGTCANPATDSNPNSGSNPSSGGSSGGTSGGTSGSSSGSASDGTTSGSTSGSTSGTASGTTPGTGPASSSATDSVPSGGVPTTLICSTDFSNQSSTNVTKAIRVGSIAYIAYYDSSDTAHCSEIIDLKEALAAKRVKLPACPELSGKTATLNISVGSAVAPPKVFAYGISGNNTVLAPVDMPMYSGSTSGRPANTNGGMTTFYDEIQFDFKGTPSLVSHSQYGYQKLENLSAASSSKLQLLYALNAAKAAPSADFVAADYGNQALCDGTASPLIIQLPSAGEEPEPLTLSALTDGVMFDILGAASFPKAHEKKQISWLVPGSRKQNYFLTLPSRLGQVNGINELFGNNTMGPDGSFAVNGYEALRKFDLNHDGLIDRDDAVFARLRLWADLNGDGQAQANELHGLVHKNVRSISLNYDVNYQEVDVHGNAIKYKSIVTTNDDRMNLIFDIWFKVRTPVE